MFRNWQLELAKEFSPNYIRIVQGMLSIAFDRAIVLGIAKRTRHEWLATSKAKDESRLLDVGGISESDLLLYKGDYYEHYLFISFWLLFMTGMRIEKRQLCNGLILILKQGF